MYNGIAQYTGIRLSLAIAVIICLLSFYYINIASAEKSPQNTFVSYKTTLKILDSDSDKDALSAWEEIRKKSLLLRAKDINKVTSAQLLLRANTDYANILAILQNYGFFGSSISILINNRETHDIPANFILPQSNNVHISINPGVKYHLRKVDISGYNYTKSEIKQLNAQGTNIKQFIANILSNLKNHGFAQAIIKHQKITAIDDKHQIDISLKIDPGPIVHLTHVLYNNETAKPRLNPDNIAFLAGFHAGDLATPQKIQYYHDNLSRLDLFDTIILNITQADKFGNAALNMTLREKSRHNFSLGLNYDNTDGFGTHIGWLNRNVSGEGDHLKIDLSFNNIAVNNLNKGYNKKSVPFSYNYSLAYDLPSLSDYTWHNALSFSGEKQNLINYNYSINEAKIGAYKFLDNNWLGSSYLVWSKVKDDSQIFGKRHFSIFGFDNSVTIDKTDNTISPHKGYRLKLNVNPFFEAVKSNLASQIEIDSRAYLTIGYFSSLILAVRGQYGAIIGSNIQETPYSMQYFVGGADTLRGFRYHSIGNPSYKNNLNPTYLTAKVGGKSMASLSMELRTAFASKINFATFMDMAAVGSNLIPEINNKIGVGAGVRYTTPIGPLRFDLATPLLKDKKNPSWSVYIGVGESF